MNSIFTAHTIIPDEFWRPVQEMIPEIQAAMAGRLREVVLSNFGELILGEHGQLGMDRPAPWALLSPGYAKQVHRDYATLFVTGALYNAIQVDPVEGSVFVRDSDVPYATAHQFGVPSRHLPARPYFPIYSDGTVTSRTAEDLAQVAQDVINDKLQNAF